MTTCEARLAIFLHELRDAMAAHGAQTSTGSLSRFFARHSITRKRRRSMPPSRWLGREDGPPSLVQNQNALDPNSIPTRNRRPPCRDAPERREKLDRVALVH